MDLARIFRSDHVDSLNVGIIIASCLLAHLFPYHMVFYSYAVLGTAHYFTQISWMHDRGYFCESKRYGAVMIGFSVLACVFTFCPIADHELLYEYTFGMAIVFAALLSFPFVGLWSKLLFLVASSIAMWAIVFKSVFMAIFVVVFASFLHTFVFTISFMLLGAIKTGKTSAYVAVFALAAAELTFFLPGTVAEIKPNLAGLKFFDIVMDTYQRIYYFSDDHEANFFGFLSFTYTYHYLNWFSKAEVIKWHKVPRKRMAWMTSCFLLCVAAFFVNYAIGIVFIFSIALAHGFLELSLNLKTMRRLAWYALGRRRYAST